MATYTPPQYYMTTPAVAIPAKGSQGGGYHSSGYASGGSAYSVSPPECDADGSETSGVPSYGHSGLSAATVSTASASGCGDPYASSYYYGPGYGHGHGGGAGSAASASGVDFNEYIQDRFADSFDPIPLDRSLAVQAQTSGQLNAKHRELLELQAKAQARLAKSRARFQEGIQDAQEVRADLEWTSKKVSSLKKKAEKKHSKEYKKARERYPSPEY
ncbi:hypothetical protein DL766_003963 [Monosporascus sp. MC13-8B]|uniref:Biogenesis of lysosome-related organelles complex 1 subunit KXD1 n=1 Tax=Monosporascus cannonballus TaxID=155416 RepID=A0ABY0H7A0_9PEZI|nr:hypothetical protein DL762_004984 [Monosporascus cannonballus]RYO96458.1 hypothetical protein DL763_003207 [Monosporascus cannonballus]RYP32475.1 hypothetical protein DL766_003963 [Monosporascus sp. MC13-8B]